MKTTQNCTDRKTEQPDTNSANLQNGEPAGVQVHVDYMMMIVDSEIEFMKRAASSGDVKAIEALHRIALMATTALNSLDDEKKRNVAVYKEWWPLNLSWVPAWNNNVIRDVPASIGLGRNVSAIFDMEAVLKRMAPTKMLGASIVNYVENCRRHGLLIQEIRKNYGGSKGEVSSQIEQKLVNSFNAVRKFTSTVGGYMSLALAPLTQESLQAEMQRTTSEAEKALQLPPLLTSKESRAAWFDFGMKLIEWFTDGKYERTQYCLAVMNRKREAEAASEIRAGIRQGIKEGFDAVIVNVSPKGFVVVD